MSRYDAIVIGAGHNGLIAANYLADAGKKVLVLERRGLVGGATVTEEFYPGFRASSCAYVSGLLHKKILKDLELHKTGLHLYQTDVGASNILRDGRHLFLYNELGKTLRGLEEIAPGEGERLMAFGLRLERFASIVNRWLLVDEPPSLDHVISTFIGAGEEELFTEFFTLSGLDLVNRYFESDIVKGLLMFTAMVSVWGGPRTPGWAYVYGHHAIGEYDGRMGQFAFPRGGMGAIADALALRATSRGVEIRTDAGVAQVNVVKGRVSGVTLSDGSEVGAPFVLSNADPQQTLLKLVGGADLPPEYRKSAGQFDQRGSMGRVLFALDKLPDFIGLPGGEGPQHRGLTLLGAEVESFERVSDAQRYGDYPDDFPIEFIIQSVHDDSMAPPGKHVLSTGVQQLPFNLNGRTWDDEKSRFTSKVIDVLETYAPDIRGSIIATHTITPLDLEREYGLPGGNIFHGAMTLGQVFDSRPLPGWGSYRTPVPGLYMCGAGTHPGGGVIGAPGHNAAHALLRDEAEGGWSPSRAGGNDVVGAAPLLHRLMARPRVRKLGVALAQQPVIGKAADKLTKR
ncbi:MAG: NAD(P)/FAD-dependent oxidoreductase [Actinomycetes bacterium]